MATWLDKIGQGLANIAPSIPLVGTAMDFLSNASTNKTNKELAQYQYEKNLEMWNRQNEYNTPLAQMQRLKDAGLNPNLVYGSGSAVGNTTSNAPSYEAPRMQAYTNFGKNFDLAANALLNSRLNSAQVKNLEEQNRLLKYDAAAKAQAIYDKNIDILAKIQDYPHDRRIKAYENRLHDLDVVLKQDQHDMNLNSMDLQQIEISINEIRKDITQKEYDIIVQKLRTETANADIREQERFDYLQLGVRPSDPLWVRMFSNILVEVLGKDKAKALFEKYIAR